MTRRGKIARLPKEIREELNQRIENGELGARLVEWLNGLAEVKAMLEQDFEGQPISEPNLTQWKNGGFLDWQAHQKAMAMVERWGVGSPMSNAQSLKLGEAGSPQSVDCGLGIADGFPKPAADGFPATGDALPRKAGGLAGGETGGPTSNVQCPKSSEGGAGSPISAEVSAALTERLVVHYAAALEDAISETNEKPGGRVERLGRSLRDVVRVRRYDMERERARERMDMERERVAIERERLELQKAKLASRQAPGANTQARGANRQARGADDKERERLRHLEKAEMVREMVREAKEADERKRENRS